VKLLILGAGPGGLVTAYELGKLGYDIQILEARDRPGGHVWTVRRGTELTEYGGATKAPLQDDAISVICNLSLYLFCFCWPFGYPLCHAFLCPERC